MMSAHMGQILRALGIHRIYFAAANTGLGFCDDALSQFEETMVRHLQAVQGFGADVDGVLASPAAVEPDLLEMQELLCLAVRQLCQNDEDSEE